MLSGPFAGAGGLRLAPGLAADCSHRTLEAMGAERDRTASVTIAAAVDVLLVLVFALVGRASHNENAAGLLETAWPFLGGLAAGWLIMRAWRHPRRVVWTGLGIWAVTVTGGMLLRLMSGQGTAFAFILVATATLAVLLIGWRAIATLLGRRTTG